jgi:hypothetical protein
MDKPRSEADQLVEAALIVTTQITGLVHGLDVLEPARANGVRTYLHEQINTRLERPRTERAS